ncbi:MAG: [Fe-Fe] hydrogenase large subunit C-terminal domain-containing protein [bacterium]|nr:[Fe-Fe] hydrogenase large subunit C-terminal domain-containing protein [bacterium]
MNEKYHDLYKGLVKAYYDSHFEDEFAKFLEGFENQEEAKSVLATLCGVEEIKTKDDHEFVYHLINAITKNQVRDKIVAKVSACSEDCETSDGKSKCMNVCPFEAIKRDDKTGDKWIQEDLCMSCGRCVKVCDMGHYMDVPQSMPLLELLKNHEKVIAMVAPAIAGQFGPDVTLDQLREAFIKIGFTDMFEVAMGADVLSMKEALEYNELVNEEGDFMITSCCCPMWVAMLKKLYNDLVPEVSPSVSPMVAMGRIIKALNNDVKCVFVGPCVAKKAEAKEPDISDSTDYVLTFQEVQLLFEAFDIDPGKLKGVPSPDYASTGGRLYARAGGVSEAVFDVIDQMFPEKRKLFTSLHVDGIKDCKKMLNDLEAGHVRASFIEGMGCSGGCVGGPKALIAAEEGKEFVNQFAHDSAVKMPMHSEIIEEVLNKLGINSLEDLRNDHSMFERKFE